MSGFIRVLGDDPIYQGLKAYMWIDIRMVNKAYPVHAVEEGDKLRRSTFDHEGARLASHRLIDMDGVEYTCGNPVELRKLGIDVGPDKPNIGFVNGGDDPDPVDMG